MRPQYPLAKFIRLTAVVLGAAVTLFSVMGALAQAGVQSAALQSYGSDPQLRGLAVIADGGVMISDTQPNIAPASGSKTVYFSAYTAGTITVTPDITGTAPLTIVREIGLDGTTLLAVSAATAPLIQPIPDTPIMMEGSQDVTFTLQNDLGVSTVFTLSFKEDKFTPTVSLVAPTAGQVLTLSAPSPFNVVMAAMDPSAPEASGIQSVQVITGDGGAAQNGLTIDNVEWTYQWPLSVEDNVTHTLLITATDYVGNYTTTTRLITVDNQAPGAPSVVTTTNGIITGTDINTTTIPIRWTAVSDGSGVSYYYTWTLTQTTSVSDSDPSTMVTETIRGNLPSGDNWFHVRPKDGAGNWGAQTDLGPFAVNVAPTIAISTTDQTISISVSSPFTITGFANDTDSNVRAVTVTVTNTNAYIITDVHSYNQRNVTWSYAWPVAESDYITYSVRAQARDTNSSGIIAGPVKITVDNVVPINPAVLHSTVPTNTWMNLTTIPITWPQGSDGSNVITYSYTLTTATPYTPGSSDSTTALMVTPTVSADGVYTFYLRTRDKLGNWAGNVVNLGPFKRDNTAPTGGSVNINAGAAYATSTAVTLTLNASDTTSGLYQMALSNDGTTWVTQTYATTTNWTLTSGDGAKTVYVRFTDHADNVSGNATDTITLDTTAPTGGNISINAGATYANQVTVTLALNASDATSGLYQMVLSNDGTTWVTQTYATTTNWTLASGDGAKTVYVRFTDHAGNVSGNATDTITLDTTAPTGGSISINAGATYANQVTVTLALNASDATSGLAQMAFSNDGTTWVTLTYATTANWTLSGSDGAKTVYARFADNAGNVSGNTNNTIFLDRVAPTIASPDLSITFNPGSALYHPIGTTTLYYTNTSIGSFRVAGGASDPAPSSGLHSVIFSTAFGGTPLDDASPLVFGGDYDVYSGATESGLITATVFDKAGNGRPQTYTYQLDADPPYTGSLNINAGAQYVTQTQVNLALAAADTQSSVSEMCVSNSSSCTTWEAYATSKSWTINSTEGVKTAWVWFRDNVHNAAGPFTDTITLDTAAPTGGNVSLNGEATYANSTAVTLTLNASDATSGLYQMAFSNDGTTWITQTYATSANWTLSSGDGLKTIYARFTDNAGNVSGNASDTITLDQQAPTGGSISLNGGVTYANQTAISLTLGAIDATSGLAQMAFSNDGVTWQMTQSYGTSANWALPGGDGLKTVYARFTDNAGNVSGNTTDTITLDTALPTGESLNINAGATYANQVTVTLALSASDATSGLSQMALSNDGTTWFTQTYATTTNWNLSSGDGTKTVFARFTDNANNVSVNVNDTVSLDTIAPQVTLTLPQQISATQVVALWTGFDPGDSLTISGLYSYSLGYVRDDGHTLQPQTLPGTATTTTIPITGEHTYTFTLRAHDAAGNNATAQQTLRVAPFRIYLPLVANNYWACPSIDIEPNNAFTQTQAVTLTGSPVPGTIVSGNFCLGDPTDVYSFTKNNSYLYVNFTPANGTTLDLFGYNSSKVLVFTASGGALLKPDLPAGQYYLKVQPRNSGPAYAQPYTLTINDIPQILSEDWSQWVKGWGGFPPYGGDGLPASFAPTITATLGSPSYNNQDGHIPVGYASITRTVFVPAGMPTVTLSYNLVTYDTIYGTRTSRYFDTFEISVNSLPTEEQRNGSTLGCQGAALNPNNETRTPQQDGLIACGGGPTGNSNLLQIQGTLRINLSHYANQYITLYFILWNREYAYQTPNNNNGTRNTYVDVGHVKFIP